MRKISILFAFISVTMLYQTMAGPIEVEKSADDDLNTSETFGFGYYQPGVYSAPLVASAAVPLSTAGAIAAPYATATALNSLGFARSGYGSNYKYGSNYGYGSRWGYGSGGAVNDFYRRHPVYVAWG